MTVYPPSTYREVNVGNGHGGCGQIHRRPLVNGEPVKVWALDCARCEDHLRADPMWSPTISDIRETHDEKLAREDFEKRGAKDKDAVLTLALARLAGIGPSELPESLTRMISGQPMHIPVQGQIECQAGHAQPAGVKFCNECGQAMSRPATAGALESPQQPAGSSPDPAQASQPQRLQDAQADLLRSLARSRGLDTSGTRADLIGRLKDAGVSNADLRAFTAPVAA